jgi:hypothetical protein
MLILNVKLARHGRCSALVADDCSRAYNIAKLKMVDTGVIVCREEDFDLTRAEFDFPTMVSEERAKRRYAFI